MHNLDQKHQELITKQFYSIFYGKNPIPTGEISQIFNTYLANNALSFEKSIDGTSYPQINSMHAVTRYLTDHADKIKSCDFRAFKTHINGIPVLAEYLKTSTIKAVAINSNISTPDKESLAIAVAARKGGLKIQYS